MMNRRTFVSSLAMASAAVATRSKLFGADAQSRIKVGVIGCGWFGGVILQSLSQNAAIEVVSLCDPNKNALKDTLKAVAAFQSGVPRTFADYREMLASAAHEIVVVATPDHWHALPGIAAMKAGADVVLEKPISVDVMEGEALVAAARKYNRVVQVNTQRRSTKCLAEARDKYIRSGKLGKIGLIETYSYLHGRPDVDVPEIPPPEYLDYELWTGPAPMRPYNKLIESKGWRAFMEYGNGQIGDLGVHIFDCVRWMMNLGWPQSVSSTGGIYVNKSASSNISDTQRSVFHYPDVDISWEHRTWGPPPIPQRHWTDLWGARFLGSEGTLNITTIGYEFIPGDGSPREGFHMLSETGNLENLNFNKFGAAYGDIQKWHVLDFLQAREKRSLPIADVEEGHISTASCVLANLALDLGRPLAYDPKTRTIPGDAEATRRLARNYRGPWQHPNPAAV